MNFYIPYSSIKYRPISHIHSIWLETKERKKRLKKELSDYVDYITSIEEFEDNKGYYVIYNDEINGLYKYIFKKNHNFDISYIKVDLTHRTNKIIRHTKHKSLYNSTKLENIAFNLLYHEVMIWLSTIEIKGSLFDIKIDNKIYILQKNDLYSYQMNDGNIANYNWLGEKKDDLIILP